MKQTFTILTNVLVSSFHAISTLRIQSVRLRLASANWHVVATTGTFDIICRMVQITDKEANARLEDGPIRTADGVEVPFAAKQPAPSNQIERNLVVLAHGITANKTEDGLFDRTAEHLLEEGYETLQFDYRGHGESKISSTRMTIAGEVLDLEAVIRRSCSFTKTFLIASSFGAVSTCLMAKPYKQKITALILWNPVLSLSRTFLDPELPWQKKNFGKDRITAGLSSGRLCIDESFVVGDNFLKELEIYRPDEKLLEFECPILVLHGDQDTYVSHDVAKCVTQRLSGQAAFVTIEGAEHGFGRPAEEKLVIRHTTSFIKRHS